MSLEIKVYYIGYDFKSYPQNNLTCASRAEPSRASIDALYPDRIWDATSANTDVLLSQMAEDDIQGYDSPTSSKRCAQAPPSDNHWKPTH